MARNINADGTTPVYRAIIRVTHEDGTLKWVKYEGPYTKPAAALGRVSFWTNYLAPWEDTAVEAWIEEGTVNWKKVD